MYERANPNPGYIIVGGESVGNVWEGLYGIPSPVGRGFDGLCEPMEMELMRAAVIFMERLVDCSNYPSILAMVEHSIRVWREEG